MPVTPPTTDDIAAIARRYGLTLRPGDAESFRDLARAQLASYHEIERLHEEAVPPPIVRNYQRPSEADNEFGAWHVTTDISTGADGPLAGRRIAVKDNIAVAGVPMTNGSPLLEGFIPRRDATVVARLLAAGATIAGKAVCEGLCWSGGSHTASTGPVRNPWDRARTTGGSSSGSAALVAARQVDMALGGDQGGSIRIPSSFCGVVGHKPTHGLVPYTGAFSIENTIDHLGPIAATVRDAALMLSALAGPDGLDPRQQAGATVQDYLAAVDAGIAGLRVGVLAEGFAIPGLSQPGVDGAVRAAIDVLAAAGARVREVSIPWHRAALHLWVVIATDGAVTQMIDGNGFGMNWPGRYDPDLLAHYARARRERADEMPENLKASLFTGRHSIDSCGGRHYAMARNLALDAAAAYDEALAELDVLVLPTLPIVATPIPPAGATREESIARSTEMIANTAPFDVTGHPATSVPAGLVDGLPTGLMIVGRRFDDAACLRVAAAYEAAVGGFPAPPGAAASGS